MEHVALFGKRCGARLSMSSQQDKAAEWMRSLSERLWSSHHGSAPNENSVAKGRTRETQVLNIFEGLLPRGVTVGQDVVIVDSIGTGEAPNFDGLVYDRMRFPVLYFEKDSANRKNKNQLSHHSNK